MVRVARALREWVPEVEHVATSPLLRAVQTGELLAKACGGLEIETIPQLEPGGDVRKLGGWLAACGRDAVALVGHEPDLSAAVCWLSAGSEEAFLELGKGGAALLEFPGAVGAGRARLQWLLRPGQLRRLE
jgi:phosphohistidine phosphatase